MYLFLVWHPYCLSHLQHLDLDMADWVIDPFTVIRSILLFASWFLCLFTCLHICMHICMLFFSSAYGHNVWHKWMNKQMNNYFYSASALLAMQSAVLARGILSVRPSVRLSVRLSVTFRYCVQTNEDMIVRFSASGRTIPLVSGEVKFFRIFAGDHPQRGR